MRKRFSLDIAQRSPNQKFQVADVIVANDNTQVLASKQIKALLKGKVVVINVV